MKTNIATTTKALKPALRMGTLLLLILLNSFSALAGTTSKQDPGFWETKLGYWSGIAIAVVVVVIVLSLISLVLDQRTPRTPPGTPRTQRTITILGFVIIVKKIIEAVLIALAVGIALVFSWFTFEWFQIVVMENPWWTATALAFIVIGILLYFLKSRRAGLIMLLAIVPGYMAFAQARDENKLAKWIKPPQKNETSDHAGETSAHKKAYVPGPTANVSSVSTFTVTKTNSVAVTQEDGHRLTWEIEGDSGVHILITYPSGFKYPFDDFRQVHHHIEDTDPGSVFDFKAISDPVTIKVTQSVL